METPKRAQCHFSKGLLLSGKEEHPGAAEGWWDSAQRLQCPLGVRERLPGKKKLLELLG